MPPPPSPMRAYRLKRDSMRPRVLDKYEVIGFISSGTYGRVYKARQRSNPGSPLEYAIKKFKPDKEGETQTYTGISQSACREIALCREVNHENIIDLTEVMLEDKSIYMIFEFAEHDFLQIIHHHNHTERKPIPESIVKSFLWQLINGVFYLHSNWILHRDLKPANILVTAAGVIKIGDLGLARLFNRPLQPLFNGDKVVVTIWYRAPELLLGSRHYTPAIDLWATGCIFAELLSLRPIFKGEELKMDTKKNVPFQKPQLTKIFEVLGFPTRERWPSIDQQPEYPSLLSMRPNGNYSLKSWYQATGARSESGFDLLARLFEYDPNTRITAEEALNHSYWNEDPKPSMNSFAGQQIAYPTRRVSVEDKDMRGTKHALGGVANPSSAKDDRNTKRSRIV